MGSNPTLCIIILIKTTPHEIFRNYATIDLTLVTECADISLCMSATTSSLKAKLHLKHFQDSVVIIYYSHKLLIRILHD